ncbi:MAG TPA: hypothetical protein VFQ62_00840 [Methylomirabilota bacterium]|nr:hypothetical protein [Methylomirabilota bacterium]
MAVEAVELRESICRGKSRQRESTGEHDGERNGQHSEAQIEASMIIRAVVVASVEHAETNGQDEHRH